MNKQCFKTVFSKRLGCLVAVGEHTTSQGKANGGGCAGGGLVQFVGLLAAGFALVGLAWAQPAVNALPTGGVVAQGAASVSTSGAVMNITQSTPKAVLNWQSFDIGKDAKVNIQQPGVDAVMLNRVTGANPSQIFGQLSANGQVVLVNPNGVLFGKDGSVSASSFTASTLGISDANFMAGNMLFERNGSTAGVVNQGTIRATGAYVALLGASVSNEGRIETNGGAALLGAGETVKVPLGSSGRIKLELSPSAINAAVANSKEGTIVTHGGQVYMQAAALNTAVASILHSGSIETTGEQGGAVHLLADGGQIRVDGSITANSTGQDDKGQPRKGGDIVIGRDEETGTLAASTDMSGASLETNRGFVETSGHQLTIDNTRVVAKDWLLDPDNIQITNDASLAAGYTSRVSATALGQALSNGVNVTLNTTPTNGTGLTTSPNNPTNLSQNGAGTGGTTAAGNIFISNEVVMDGVGKESTLTLIADNGIIMNQAVKVKFNSDVGQGKLNLNFTAKGKPSGVTPSAANADSLGIIIGGVGAMSLNGGDLTLTGTSYKNGGAGVLFQPAGFSSSAVSDPGGATLNISAGNITVNGTANTFSGSTGYGVFMTRYPNPVLLSANGNVNITGIVTGDGTGSGFSSVFSGNNNFANSITAGGTLMLRGNNRTPTSNSSAAVYADGGLQLRSVGNMVVQAETNTASSTAIDFTSNLGDTVRANTSLRSIDSNGNASGNVLIQTNQGGIRFNNQLADATSSRDITGVNITIDNTGAGMTVNGIANANGGSINASTGAITAGTGKATGAGVSGVNLGDNRTITATGNFNLYGASNANAWAVISAAKVTAANFSVQGYNSNPNGTVSGGGLQLKTGASFTGTATSGSNLIKGTWGASQFGSTYGLLVGDSSSSNVSLTSAADSTLSIEGYNNMTSVLAGNMYYSPGLHTQGAVNTSGTVTLKGYSQVHHGLAINGTLTHTGGALTLDGTSQPFSGYPASGGSSAGVLLNGNLNVNGGNNLTVTGTNKTTNSSNQSGSTAFGVNTASGSQLNGSGGTLSITGLTPMNSGLTAANLPKTQAIYSAGSISGWGNTTLLGQNAANSSLSAVQVMGNITVGNSKLNVLANGGQIYQGSGSTLTAGLITTDNTGAGRSSLFTDYSVTPNIALNANYGGSIDVNGKVITMGSAATTSSSAMRGLDLNGAMITTGDINLTTNSGAYINSTLTSTTGDINAQAKSTVEIVKVLSATSGGATGGNITLTSTGGEIIQRADTTASKIVSFDNSTATGRSLSRSAGVITADTVTLRTYNQIGAEDIVATAVENRIKVSANSLYMSSIGSQYVSGSKAMTVAVQSTSGDIKIKTTAGSLDVGSVANVSGISTTGSVDLNAAASITASHSIAAGNLYLTAGNTIGTSNDRITTNAVNISASSAGNLFITATGSGSVSASARTTANNGDVDIRTIDATLFITTVNGLSGVAAHGLGDITLVGNQSGASGYGLSIGSSITTVGGDIALTGTTAANNRPGDAFAGVRNGAAISGVNITVTAMATDPTADVLGYYGGGGSLFASGNLTATGTSAGAGVGFYMWSGVTRSGSGMTISGVSSVGPGVSLTNSAQVRNTTSGAIAIAGSTNNTATQVAVGLFGASVINDQGAVGVTSGNGSITASSGTNALSAHGAMDVTVGNASATNSDGIDASTLTITQSANANVTLTTSGTGDLTAPKVVNNGSGNVVLGAGINHQTAAGGNVRTVAGNTVTQAAGGKTYVYSGSLSGTGSLSALDTSFGSLYYQGTSHVLNTAFGQTYGATITGGADAQVLFRQALDPSYGFALDLSGITLTKNYGQSDPAIPAAVVAAYAGPATLTTSVSGAGGDSNTLALTAADALATLAGTRTAGEDASSTPYAYTLTAGLGTTVSGQPSLQINRASLSAVLTGSVTKTYDGTDWATGLTSANFSVTGWVGSDGATVGQTVGNYANANVAANTGSGTVTATLEASHFTATGSTRLSNYILPTSAAGNVGTITRAPLTVKVNDTAMFVTQNPNTATDHGFSVTGLRNGETAANVLGPLSRTYTGAANPNAGLYTNVYELVAVPSPANYNLTVEKGSLRVAAADKLLITLSSHSETYGVLTTVNAGPTAGQPVAQYCLVSTNCNGANIVNLTMTDLGGGQWKATDPNNAWVSFSTAVDAANANSRGGYLNAGNYRYNIAGFSTGNTVNFAGTELSAGVLTITPKTLGLTATNVSKVYDGTTSVAGVGLTPTGALAGDDVLVAPAGGSFNSKAVGSQGFSLTGLQLQGQDSANYAFSAGTFTGTGTITPRLLSLSALVPDKVYDGTTQAGLSGLSLSGVVAGDVVTVSGGSASFADRHVARDASGQVLAKSVAVSGALLGGADAGNYQLDGSVAASARILPLTVSAGIVARDKVYDGTADAQFQGVITGVLAGDTVSLLADSSRFVSRHVQRDSSGQPVAQSVLATGLRLSGTDAGNYSLSSTSAAGSATITPKLLQASAAVADKMYDGTRVAALSGLGGTGIVAGDAAVVEAESATFAGKDVLRDAAGQVLAQTVTVAGLKVSGADAGNYVLSATDFTASARITPRTLSVVGTRVADKMQDGTTRASVTLGVLTGLVGQEQLLTSAQGSFRSASVGLNKPVDVVYSLQDGTWGGMAANYELPSQVLQATIFAPNSVVPVQPVIAPTSPSGGSRVVMAPAMPAVATTAEVPDQGVCSSLLTDQCRCSETALEDVEVCVLPREGSLASEAVSRKP